MERTYDMEGSGRRIIDPRFTVRGFEAWEAAKEQQRKKYAYRHEEDAGTSYLAESKSNEPSNGGEQPPVMPAVDVSEVIEHPEQDIVG